MVAVGASEDTGEEGGVGVGVEGEGKVEAARHLRRGRLLLRRHHLRGARPADAAHGAGEPLRRLRGWRDRHATPSRLAHARPPLGTGDGLSPVVLRRRALDRHGDDGLPAHEHQAQRALLLALLLLALGRDLPELLAVGEDEVHELVKRHELADEHAAVLDGDAHAVVDQRQHLAAARDARRMDRRHGRRCEARADDAAWKSCDRCTENR